VDTRYLDNFVLVVELGSIAEAARRLDLTPATLAQRLRTLEVAIGTPLIVRAGRTVRPTPAGTRIVDRARAILHEVRDLRAAASDTELPAGPLRLGATPTALTGIVPLVLKDWARNYPHINIYIEPGSSHGLYGRVLDNHLDAAVLVHPLFDMPKTCGWQGLRNEPLILLAPAGLAITDVLGTIAREPFIRYDRTVVAGKMADDYLRQHGIRPHAQFELDGIENIALLVAQGLGISVLPDWSVAATPNPLLRKWPLPPPVPARHLGITWLRTGVRAPLVKAFVELAQRHFPPPQKTGQAEALAALAPEAA